MKRGPYAGVVGYLDFSGNLDTAITIRTMVWRGDQASVQAGAGSWPTRTRRPRTWNAATRRRRCSRQPPRPASSPPWSPAHDAFCDRRPGHRHRAGRLLVPPEPRVPGRRRSRRRRSRVVAAADPEGQGAVRVPASPASATTPGSMSTPASATVLADALLRFKMRVKVEIATPDEAWGMVADPRRFVRGRRRRPRDVPGPPGGLVDRRSGST